MTMYRGSGSPFDYLTYNGRNLMGLECKLIRERKSGKPKSFPFSRVSEVQRDGLAELDTYKNAYGFLLINFRYFKKKGRLFALHVSDFLQLEDDFGSGIYQDKYRNKKSIPLEYFLNEAREIKRLGKGWDLRQLKIN